LKATKSCEAALRAKVKNREAEMIRSILPSGVACIFVRQPEQLSLGHAVLCAERAVGSEPFAVLLADDFLTCSGTGATYDVLKAFSDTKYTQLSVMQVDGPDISRYGVIVPGTDDNEVRGLIEKPAFENAPSNLASIGRYVLAPDVFDILRNLPAGAGGELQLADAINVQGRSGRAGMVNLKGERFDCGLVQGFLAAIIHVAGKQGLL
jgi:UTP--glucose-1-phosphate uridylyltransferase